MCKEYVKSLVPEKLVTLFSWQALISPVRSRKHRERERETLSSALFCPLQSYCHVIEVELEKKRNVIASKNTQSKSRAIGIFCSPPNIRSALQIHYSWELRWMRGQGHMVHTACGEILKSRVSAEATVPPGGQICRTKTALSWQLAPADARPTVLWPETKAEGTGR